jgi:hypothetical protein
MYHIEISETLLCFVLTLDVTNTLPVDVSWRQVPSEGILVYAVEELFQVTAR